MGNYISGWFSGSSRSFDIIVKVKTGDKKGAGTDANVKVNFINEHGVVSVDHVLNVLWRNDFESGSIDDFEIKNLSDFGRVIGIELWRDTAGLMDDWYVEWVTVTNIKTNDHSVFPIHRWIPPNKKLRINEFDTFLPQHDANWQQRIEELKEKKNIYQTEIKIDGWLPQLKSLPSEQLFSNDYAWDLAILKAGLIVQTKFKSVITGKWSTVDDILSIYNTTLWKPYCCECWKSDESFGQQRLNCCNPTQIRRFREIPENFPVTDVMLWPFLEGMSIQEAIDARKLYYIDYKILENLPCPDNRVVPAPIALFFVNGQGKLMPVAIQLFQKPAEENPVFLPSDDENVWLLAKMWFNNADATYHQSCTHLAYTHLLMEPIAVATHRSLSPSHPMFRLLAPHFLYLMAVNTRGLSLLLIPGGWVDKCMTVGCLGMFKLWARSLAVWRLDVQGTLPKDLEERGVDDVEALPNYHYRDDALLLYNAIKNYVSAVVTHFYDSPQTLKEDTEIQEWACILATHQSEGGTGIPGVPGGGKLEKVEDVVDLITAIIFMGSVAHSACNFPQYDDYGFPPNYPGFLMGKPISDKTPRSTEDVNKTLITKEMTIDMLVITRLLTMRGTNSLGDFEVQYLFDPASEKAAENFRKELTQIAKIIDKRNKERTVPYTWLHPDNLPNSITI
ncbi:Arachidonate 15-lipoxygenase B [Holothuria leucospilota]|uniref:Arachidonate 15-lipoxygenase B n=1 Tax=Holothuria leucospilota TaxID=206669 RepID=A0A9Q1H375_HOLLE|nr:Arachidonate 15-lipoxygenase B [Holothuria leucospilota]